MSYCNKSLAQLNKVLLRYILQKQPSRAVLGRRCSVALQFHWNCTLALVFSRKFDAYSENTFFLIFISKPYPLQLLCMRKWLAWKLRQIWKLIIWHAKRTFLGMLPIFASYSNRIWATKLWLDLKSSQNF